MKKDFSNGAMSELMEGLTNGNTSNSGTGSNQEQKERSLSSRQRKYKEENERVCTIINVELMNKARYIADKEGINIREVFEAGLNFAIKDYESKNGPIHTRKTKSKKGDAKKVFDI